MTTPPYQFVEMSDNSHVAAMRRVANVVIDPRDIGQARAVLLEAMKIARRAGVECLDGQGRLHLSTFKADVAWVFLYDDSTEVGVKAARARAMFVRKGHPEQFTPMFPKGSNGVETVKVDGGIVKLALP